MGTLSGKSVPPVSGANLAIADDTASENNTAETKSASGKKTSAKGGSSNGKRKMPGEANTKSSVKRVKEEA